MQQQPSPVSQVVAGITTSPGFEVKKKKGFFSLKRILAMAIGTAIGIPMMLIGFVHFQTAVFTRASDTSPRDLVISETTETTATVHWSTGEATQGTILYGTESTSLRSLAPEASRVTDHTVTLELLAPETTYYFMIRIGDELYDNGGEPWVFSTKSLGGRAAPTIVQPTSSTCPRTDDCNQIRERMGKGCTATDYVQCVKKKQ